MSIYGKEDDAKIQKDLDPYTGLVPPGCDSPDHQDQSPSEKCN